MTNSWVFLPCLSLPAKSSNTAEKIVNRHRPSEKYQPVPCPALSSSLKEQEAVGCSPKPVCVPRSSQCNSVQGSLAAQVAVSWSHTGAYTKQSSKDAFGKKRYYSNLTLFCFVCPILLSFVPCWVAAATADEEGVDGSQVPFCDHPTNDLGLQSALTCASDMYFTCLHGPYSLYYGDNKVMSSGPFWAAVVT